MMMLRWLCCCIALSLPCCSISNKCQLSDGELYDEIQGALNTQGCEELLGAVVFTLTDKPQHAESLCRLKDNRDAFFKYLVRMADKKIEDLHVAFSEDPDKLFDDYMSRFAVQKSSKEPSWMGFFQTKTQEAYAVYGLYNEKELARINNVADLIKDHLTKITANTKYLKDMVAVVQEHKELVGSVLLVGYLGWNFAINVREWYLGRIDGMTATKNVASTFASTLAGIAGAAVMGTAGGPAGAVLGGYIGSSLSTTVITFLFDAFFGSDKYRAIAKAYDTLGLTRSASPAQVRDQYLKLAKKTHPDKGGTHEEYLTVNTAYELIRAECLNKK